MFWAVATYFNPAGYRSRQRNFLQFAAGLRRQGVSLLTVELAFGDREFELPSGLDVIQKRSNDVMWQKERLLNVALEELPKECDNVAWLDCDLIFLNDKWALETERQLERHCLVQPFEEVRQRGWISINFPWGCRHAKPGQPTASGFGWAGRKELLLTHGFYDAAILGGGDKLMSSAMIGRVPRQGLDQPRTLPLTDRHMDHYMSWQEPFYREVQGNLGYVTGSALHLDHGTRENRNYWDRYIWLADNQFDPHSDIIVGQDLCWHWNSPKPELHAVVHRYFQLRREDES
jgi:hypothetical protein